MAFPSTISTIFTIVPTMTDALVSLGKKAAKALEDHSFVSVVTHNDADGLTAGGIISSALLRSNTVFQTTTVSSLNQDVVDRINGQVNEGAVVFCDMGSGQPELVEQVRADVVIIDHHQVVGDHDVTAHVNPHLVGADGSRSLSASGTAYFVARAMGDNVDLAGLALTGAVGDKQRMDGPNGAILREALEAGVVHLRKGLKVPDGPVEEVLLTLVEPYLDTAGDRDATREFLAGLGISGPIQDLELAEISTLASAMALKIAGRAEPQVVQSMVGDVVVLDKEVVHNIYSLEWMLNCCGKMDRPSLGLALCLRDASVVDEAVRIASGYQQTLVEQVRSCEAKVRELDHIRYVVMEDSSGTGIVTGTLIRYVYPDKPFIGFNVVEDMIKVSARGTRRLVDRGLDLAAAMREAASMVGGRGGGHNVASGANIPPGTRDEFLAAVNTIVGGQLG